MIESPCFSRSSDGQRRKCHWWQKRSKLYPMCTNQMSLHPISPHFPKTGQCQAQSSPKSFYYPLLPPRRREPAILRNRKDGEVNMIIWSWTLLSLQAPLIIKNRSWKNNFWPRPHREVVRFLLRFFSHYSYTLSECYTNKNPQMNSLTATFFDNPLLCSHLEQFFNMKASSLGQKTKGVQQQQWQQQQWQPQQW